MTISSFTEEYRFLSNFWIEPKRAYKSVEHYYQAAKSAVPEEQAEILSSETTPGQAKRLGQKVTLRPDWDQIKDSVMEQNIRSKFTLDDELRAKLLATGDEELIEGNTWDDKVWGAVWNEETEEWEGENRLGKLLMRVRAELQLEDAERKAAEL